MEKRLENGRAKGKERRDVSGRKRGMASGILVVMELSWWSHESAHVIKLYQTKYIHTPMRTDECLSTQ